MNNETLESNKSFHMVALAIDKAFSILYRTGCVTLPITISIFFKSWIMCEIMSMVPVGPKETQLVCPSCHASIVSRVEHKATTKTHILAGLLFFFLCWPCVCVPYCVDSCQNADHYCPSCNAYLGTYAG